MSIVHALPMAEIITAVAFTPDGKVSICGSFNGICTFFNTAGLVERSRITIESSGSSNGVTSKITGLQTLSPSENIEATTQAKLMITTNDSRVRTYRLSDQGLIYKLEGIRNQSSQIHARFNDSGEYAVCGSEDDTVHIWHLHSVKPEESHERFHTNSEAVTNAIMAPMVTRKLLGHSQDPIYNLCKRRGSGCNDSLSPWKHAANMSCISPMTIRSSTKTRVEGEVDNDSSKHHGGHIFVTTDALGMVKVYRQDCAFDRRYYMPHNYQVPQLT
jgi:WD40 repeat protein